MPDTLHLDNSWCTTEYGLHQTLGAVLMESAGGFTAVWLHIGSGLPKDRLGMFDRLMFVSRCLPETL